MSLPGLGVSLGPIRGRETELALLHERVRIVAGGEGGTVLVEGSTGAGKSRLIFDAVVAATALGVSVAAGTADERAQLVPFSPLVNALGGAVGAPPPGILQTRYWLLERMRSELEARAARGPMLIALDELQFADQGTLQAIQSLTPQLATYPLLWLLAGRAGGPSAGLGRLFGVLEGQGGLRINLLPLSVGAVAAMIRDIVRAEPDRDLLALTSGAEGNPSLVVDLVEGLMDEGAIAVAGGMARLVSDRLPERLHTIVVYRLGRLSPDARRLVEVAAVLGRSFAVDDLVDIMGEPAARLLPAVSEARTAGVLLPAGDALAFRHDLVRSAVYQQMPASVRAALHRQIGGLMLERGATATAAAGHFLQGAAPGDQRALAALDEAAATVLASAPESAAELALRALELTAPNDVERFERALVAVDALTAASRLDEAQRVAADTVARSGLPPIATARLHLALSGIEFMHARHADAVDAADAVLAQPGLDVELYDSAEEARLMSLMAQDVMSARPAAEAILAGRARSGTDRSLPGALTALGSIAWIQGRAEDAIGLLRSAVARDEQEPRGARRTHPRQSLAVFLTAIGEFEEAEALLRRDRDDVERTGDGAWLAAVTIRVSSLCLASGRMWEAAAEAHAGIALAADLNTPLFVPLARVTLALAAHITGDHAAAAAHVERCRADLPRSSGFASSYCDWVDAAQDYAAHGPERAVVRAAALYTGTAAKRLFMEEPAAAPWLVRTALAARDPQRAEQVAAAVERVAEDNPGFVTFAAVAAHARGLIDHRPAALEAAIAGYRHPWARAWAMEDAGLLLAGSDQARARLQLEGSVSAYEAIGAAPDAERACAALDRLEGGRRLAPPPRPLEGWQSLTDAELVIAELVAEGLTNSEVATRLSVSRHTVDSHLRAIFRKLQVKSRVELTRLAMDHDDHAKG